MTADYREGVYVGYRWYDARKMPVRWPFGHGLSYTGAPVPGGRVPQALRRFAKIDLQPGEEQEVVFTLTPQDISRYSPELHAWCAAPGRYEIRIGHSSRDIRAVLALQYADAKI